MLPVIEMDCSFLSIGHVEAGLRTNNKYSPFPEEMNRQMVGVLADLHFSPTLKSAENLKVENKNEQSISITGNTAIDAMKTTVNDHYSCTPPESVNIKCT